MIRGGIYKTEGVVLSRKSLSETSLIIDLYTQNFGRILAVAKGAKRPKNILGGSLQMFTHLCLILYIRKNLSLISSAEVINPFSGIRNDPNRIVLGCYLVELIKAMVKGGLPDEKLFRLILKGLAWLEEESAGKIFIPTFNLKFMKIMGLAPCVDVCVRCKGELNGVVRFSPPGGGALCKDCPQEGAIEISKGTLAVIRGLLELEPSIIKRIRLSTKIEEELRQVVGSYLHYHLPYPLKSLKVLEDIGCW